MDVLPFRPSSFYYRQIAREGNEEELREALLRLTEDREQLRDWVRAHGMEPPVWRVPVGKLLEIIERPAGRWEEETVASLRQ